MRPTRQAPPQRLGPQVRPGRWFAKLFLRKGNVPPAVTSLLLLLAGDVETNPGPSCYVCGQNVRQSDTPLTCHTAACVIRIHKQTRCSGVPRSEQSLPWHCSTHDGPRPPVTTQTSHACFSCHHPFRSGTRPLACLAQSCMNLPHAARRCSGPTAPPDTTPSFPGFCAIRADRPTNQRGGGLLIPIRDDPVFQKTGEEYSPR